MLNKLGDRISYFYMIRYAWRFSPDRRRAALIYAMTISAHALWLSEPIFIGKAVGVITVDSGGTLASLAFWLGMALVASAIGGVLHWKARLNQRKYAFELRRKYEIILYQRLMSFPWSWHQLHHSGDTLNRVRLASRLLVDFSSEEYRYIQLFSDLIGSILFLLFLAPSVGLIVGISIPLVLLLLRHYDTKTVKFSETWNKAEHRLSAGLTDYIGNIGTVLSLRLAKASEAEILHRMDDIRPSMFGQIEATQAKWFVFGRVERLITLTALLLYYLANRHDERTVLVATMVSMLQYLKLIVGATSSFINSYQSLTTAQIALRGVDDIVRAEPSPPRSVKAMSWSTAVIYGLRFRYEDREHHLHQLDDIGLTLARGRRIALVGSSGSGKSTLLRLLRGLHEPAAGMLEIDSVAQPDFSALAGVSTLILQDAELFENTLRYNIAFGADASDKDLAPAIAMACLGPVIEPLPSRLDTDIRERGVNLSGGQKQRLALARGLFAARGSSLLLMDEPTSSLDPITEAEVFAGIFAGLPDTCIVAAIHRLHLLDRFDYVYVMEHGKVVEHGTLDTLLALNGTLARLWAAQKKDEAISA